MLLQLIFYVQQIRKQKKMKLLVLKGEKLSGFIFRQNLLFVMF